MSVYINNLPEKVELSLPYSDNSGAKYLFVFDKGSLDIKLKGGDDLILIEKKDIYWFKEAVRDMISLVEMETESNKPKVEK